MMENTATITIRLEDSALEGNVTLFLNSSTDSLIYVNMRRNFYLFHWKKIIGISFLFFSVPQLRSVQAQERLPSFHSG